MTITKSNGGKIARGSSKIRENVNKNGFALILVYKYKIS